MSADSPPPVLLGLFGDGPGAGGGIARYNCDWLAAMAPQPVHAVFRNAGQQAAELLRGGRLRIASGRLAYVRAAWQLCRQLRPTVIFCAHLHYAPLAAWLCRRFGAQLWLQLHGVEAWPCPTPARRRAAESAALVSCVSRYSRSRFLQWARIDPQRVRVLPNTVGPEFTPGTADPALRRELPDTAGPLLLTVGRLSASEAYKGHDLVIAALPALLQEWPQLQYLVAGDGDDRARLQSLAHQCGVQQQVRFLGQVSHAALPDLYRLSDLYVMPSRGEGFGIVYLEAMCCGTPALGLAGDGSADPLADGELGTLCPSASRLTESLQQALRNRPESALLARRAHNTFDPINYQRLAGAMFNRLTQP